MHGADGAAAGQAGIISLSSTSLIGCRAAVKLDWGTWLRFVWRLQLGLFAIPSVIVLVAAAVGYR